MAGKIGGGGGGMVVHGSSMHNAETETKTIFVSPSEMDMHPNYRGDDDFDYSGVWGGFKKMFDPAIRTNTAFSFRVPDDYASGNIVIQAKFYLSTTTGNVDLEYYYNNDTPGSPTNVNDIFAVPNPVSLITRTCATIITPSMGAVISFLIQRNGNNGTDTCLGYMHFFGLWITYTGYKLRG
jgi:hypothetical protein